MPRPHERRAHASRGGWRTAVRRFHRAEGGQAIYVVVVFFFLLAGLLFLVLNGGSQLNDKVAMQNAADATTVTGAAWYARGLNTVAMCNVTQAQLYSMIVLLDTLQTVTPPAEECINALVATGRDMPNDARLADWLVIGNAAAEQRFIHGLGDIVRAVDWPTYLTYDTGVLWQCAKLMDGFSHAMAAATPRVAQREAIAVASKNGAEFGFIVPLWPQLPVRDGQWSDWKNPMRDARTPDPDGHSIPAFGWVMHYYGYGADYYSGDGYHTGTGGIVGPWAYWREPLINARPMGMLDLSRFGTLFRIVSEAKFDMMFDATSQQVSLRRWEMDYDIAKSLPKSRLRRAWWDTENFDSRYPYPQSSFYASITLRNPFRPTVSTHSYSTMDWPNLGSYTRATQSWQGADARRTVWYRVEVKQSAHYPQLGIFGHAPTHPDGSPWPYTSAEMQTYYHVTLWRFNGAELQNDAMLARDFLPPPGGAPMVPILLDPDKGGGNKVANVRAHFTFNGFAYKSGEVKNWSTRFVNPNPIPQMVAYAQARVFMDSRCSWDLFTQYWQVKLVRTDRWKDDLEPLLAAVPPVEADEVASDLSEEHLKPVRDMFEAYDADFMLEVSH